MAEPIIPIESIKANARAAAERGDGPEACPYGAGTDAEYCWKDAFYIAVYMLSGEATA